MTNITSEQENKQVEEDQTQMPRNLGTTQAGSNIIELYNASMANVRAFTMARGNR